jgi:hypothetical protein
MVQPKVFISYRRDEPGNYAGQIYRWASDCFGAENVFIDVVTLGPGGDWAKEITTAVSECRVLLVVIGPQWVALAQPEQGEEDFVELEVELALERPEVSVIPVLVNGAEMPTASQLPPKLRKLAGRQALELHDYYWDHGIDALRQALEKRGLQSRDEQSPRPDEAPDRRPERTSPSPGALILQGLLLAFAAGLLGNWLVTELMPSPDEQATKAASIAVAVARRTITWAIVGSALALWLALSHRRGADAPARAIVGLLLGALAGALGGTVDALPDIADRALGSWVDPVALGATGALVGALLGGSWRPPRGAYGMLAGAAAGVLVELLFASPANPGEAAVRVTAVTGLVLLTLAGLAIARDAALGGRPTRADLPPPHAR